MYREVQEAAKQAKQAVKQLAYGGGSIGASSSATSEPLDLQRFLFPGFEEVEAALVRRSDWRLPGIAAVPEAPACSAVIATCLTQPSQHRSLPLLLLQSVKAAYDARQAQVCFVLFK